MSEPVQIALIVSVAPTLLAYASWRATKVVDRKADVIHTLTNDNLSKVTEALRVAMVRIEGQERVIAAMNEASAVAERVADRAEEPVK